MNNTVLIIDDEKDILKLLAKTLEYEGYQVLTADRGKGGLRIIKENEINVAIFDVKLPDCNGIELTNLAREISPETEVICLTAHGNIHDGVQAMKNGAFDYLVKGDDDTRIIPLVSKAAEKSRLQFRIKELESKVSRKYDLDKIIGRSPLIREAVALARKVAVLDITVLLTGPTGSGKEVFAQAIHVASGRKTHSFVALNCSAFSKELLESELFGYKSGAFTGASKDKMGLFEEANGGTIFLDEIGELNLDLQARLLRVLESGSFLKVGDTKETKADVRVIAATNRNLEEEIEKGHFREDLFYRLSVYQIKLPALNDRKEDIPELARFFMVQFAVKTGKKIDSISKKYLETLKKHTWRGNIRELRNVVERSVILCEGASLTEELLPSDFENSRPGHNSGIFNLKEIERDIIVRVLDYTQGNKTKAAGLLGVGITTLYRKIEEYHIKS